MSNSGLMRCGSITFTWAYDDTFKKVVPAEDDHFLSVPVIVKKSRHINNNPLLILNVGAVNGEYIITPGEQNITAWDSVTSKLYNCKYGNTCRKNYCAFVNCQVHRGHQQAISELNKINQDGYPKHLEIRLFSSNDKYYDQAVVSRDVDYNAIMKCVTSHPREDKLSVMQVAIHNNTGKKFTVKPQMPAKQKPQSQEAKPQSGPAPGNRKFQSNELEFYKRNARTAIQKLRELLEQMDPEVDEFQQAVHDDINDVILVLSGEMTKKEELEKIEHDFEVYMEKQRELLEAKKNAIIRRQSELTQGLFTEAEQTSSAASANAHSTETVAPAPTKEAADTKVQSKSWAEIVD